MSDDFQEKTEEATPKKLADARKKGQVARSQEFASALSLIVGMTVLYFYAGSFMNQLQTLAIGVINSLGTSVDSVEAATYWFRQAEIFVMTLLAPVFGILFLSAFAGGVAQVGFNFSVEPLQPKFKTINVFDPSNYKRFFNTQVLMKTFLGVGKLGVISVISYMMIRRLLGEITLLVYASPREIFAFVAWHGFLVGITIALILLVLGVMDLTFQKWKHKNDLKMTKQEVKDERKQTEGDAHVKSKMRSLMQSFTRNRMKDNVPGADVIVANPIHFAIALKYDADNMAAPMCVAKGARKMAILIKDIARDNGVPIVENPPLAQTLYKAVEVGAFIPGNLYHGVAEVLAYVYRLEEQMKQDPANAGRGQTRQKEEATR